MRIWTQLCIEGNVKAKSSKRVTLPQKLSDQAIALIDYYIDEQPSITAKQIRAKLDSQNLIPDGISLSTIYRVIKKKLSQGTEFTHKKMNAK